MTYRACYWVSEDGQGEIRLTAAEDADLPDDSLMRLAIREAKDIGLTAAVDREPHQLTPSQLREGLRIGDWTEM